mmetsp:Transcript_46510/g.72795  ORF Transcript_46510/g.72795 Transcript_46510/m.72795 type:complete len:235 (+) Transcript_46510:141-845(+)
MVVASLSEEEAQFLVKIQNAIRIRFAKREFKELKKEFDEEEEWRAALRRRRQRIEKLERELQHVEELQPVDVERFVASSRYGLQNNTSAASCIQGFWRTRVRSRRRAELLKEARDRAARKLQGFYRKWSSRTRKDKDTKQKGTKSRTEADKRRPVEDAVELPSMQRVRELQAKVPPSFRAAVAVPTLWSVWIWVEGPLRIRIWGFGLGVGIWAIVYRPWSLRLRPETRQILPKS